VQCLSKQVDRLAGAMPYLKEDFVLKITGSGPAQAQLEQMVADLGLETDVHLLGPVTHTGGRVRAGAAATVHPAPGRRRWTGTLLGNVAKGHGCPGP